MVKILSSFLVGILLLGAGIWLYRTDNLGLVSPIPKIFGATEKMPDVPKNDWFPKTSTKAKQMYPLNLTANSAMLVDYDSGEIIYQKNPQGRQPVASTVKIMTAMLALEKAKPQDIFTVSQAASKVGENSMILTAGEKLSLEKLLYGLILVSGNDAAVTIAENVAETEEKFVDLMNEKARFLGLEDTKFANASGLDDDNKTQYSTAYDMAVIARYLWTNFPQVRTISSTYHHYIEATREHKDFELYNDTNLLTTYPGVKGIKPGFTWEAGMCLVTYAENDGKRLIGVILGTDDRRGEMKELLDYGFAYYGIKISHPALDR